MPVDVLGGTAIRPVERHGMEAVSWFLYNKETGAIMGRTPLSWLLITVFYIIYYACLGAFWLACLFIFYQTIDDKVPKWQMDEALITSSPAVGVRPSQSWELVDSSLIMFTHTKKDGEKEVAGWGEWVERTTEFLSTYEKQKGKPCKDGEQNPDQVCEFKLSELGACKPGKNFGYDKAKPCVFLKLNKIFGLDHDYYENVTTLEDLGVPAPLINKVKTLKNPTQRKKVWIECHGENPADREAIGDIEYYPKHMGFDAKYFPYMNQDGYVSPLVAVRFLNAKAGQLIHIECRAWAGNIKYNKRDKIGRAHFELLIHNEETINNINA